eukprot:gene20549-24680_t
MENIQILHQLLREEHEVLFALSGVKALEIAQNQLPDLILLDAVMPGMDGYAVCKALRASAILSAIPVIFVTALNQPEDETRALEAGAVDFITKPFNAAVVRARVRSQLTIKRQADAMRELSLTDSLTGVANRRSFNDTMESEWRRCARDGETRAGAEVVAQRILDEVRALHIPHASSSVGPHVTVSLGMASVMPTEGMDSSALIRAADALLYRAKHTGRDRYCASEEE